jgi:hypothetical protein
MIRRGSFRRVQELSELSRLAVVVARGQLGNSEEGQRQPLEAGTKVLVKV